jgi:chromosomal replication initiator protein
MNNDQIWEAVLGEVELNLSKANFTTWFKHTFVASFEDDRIIIAVPNTFTKAWLEKKYHSQICSALESVCGRKLKEIIYKVEAKKNKADYLVNRVKSKSQPQEEGIPETPVLENTSFNKHGLNIRYIFDNFIVGKGNELAHAASKAVSANPGTAYNPLFIYGGVGLGKTHLIQAIGHEVAKKSDKIMYVSCEKFTNDYVQSVKNGEGKSFKDRYRNVDLLLIDDIQFMAGKDGTQEEFFHTFNELHQTNRQIIITSDRPPKSIPALEKRLISRFEWGMIADVVQPDIETRIAILEAKCRDKNYTLTDDILQFIANNVQNNIRELEGALNRLIAYHQFNNTPPTIDSTKNILNSILVTTKSKSINSKDIIAAVSGFFNIDSRDIISKSRKKELVYPRQIAMYMIRKETSTSFPTIGQEIGGRDHTTAMHAYNKVIKELENNEKIKQDIDSIRQIVYDNC